jgi:hypothetical protein
MIPLQPQLAQDQVANRPDHLSLPLALGWLLIAALSACKGGIQASVAEKPATICTAGVVSAKCPAAPAQSQPKLLIDEVKKIVVSPGESLSLTGENFRSSLQLSVTGPADPKALGVTVESQNRLTISIPDQQPFGMLTLTFSQDGTTQNINLFSNGGKTDQPIITADPNLICSGITFYDAIGTLQVGKRACGSSSGQPKCSSDGALGCITVSGFPSAQLSNITASSVLSGKTIAGVKGTAIVSPDCTTDGQQNCAVSGDFKAANVTAISTWDLRAGKTLAGVNGELKTNCRNAVNVAKFNYDGAVGGLPNTATTTGGTNYDYWDTIDDYDGIAPSKVTTWSAETYCDSSTWADVTTTDGGKSVTPCGSGTSYTCIYKDKISNLQVTDPLDSTGNTTTTGPAGPADHDWAAAINACNNSTYGGYSAGSWRLPTQKELMSLYEHGIASVKAADAASLNFWSASTDAQDQTLANSTKLSNGRTFATSKVTTLYVVCVK